MYPNYTNRIFVICSCNISFKGLIFLIVNDPIFVRYFYYQNQIYFEHWINNESLESKILLFLQVCSKQFAALGNFEAHRKIHSGLKNHICQIISCNKRFLTAGDLSRHQKTHSGIKPFSCEVSVYSFH